MTEIRCILTVIFMLAGFFFLAVSVAGVVRFPDFFSRLHAIGLGQALGVGFCCIGLFIYQGVNITGAKILMTLLVAMMAGPIGTHIIDRVAYKEGLKADQHKSAEAGASEQTKEDVHAVPGKEKSCL